MWIVHFFNCKLNFVSFKLHIHKLRYSRLSEPGTIEERDKKRISFYCTMLVVGLVGCVRDDKVKGQETASFQL